ARRLWILAWRQRRWLEAFRDDPAEELLALGQLFGLPGELIDSGLKELDVGIVLDLGHEPYLEGADPGERPAREHEGNRATGGGSQQQHQQGIRGDVRQHQSSLLRATCTKVWPQPGTGYRAPDAR